MQNYEKTIVPYCFGPAVKTIKNLWKNYFQTMGHFCPPKNSIKLTKRHPMSGPRCPRGPIKHWTYASWISSGVPLAPWGTLWGSLGSPRYPRVPLGTLRCAGYSRVNCMASALACPKYHGVPRVAPRVPRGSPGCPGTQGYQEVSRGTHGQPSGIPCSLLVTYPVLPRGSDTLGKLCVPRAPCRC